MTYKLVEFNGGYSIQKDNMSIPRAEGNRDYRQFIEDIALGKDTVEGADVREPSYVELRAAEYPSMAQQLDMQYWDNINGTTTWADTIQAIKDKYPKTITGGVTVADVPAWVQEEADAWLFSEQLRDYSEAVARLAQYRLADGRAEVKGDIVIGQEPKLDDEGLPVFDANGQVFVDITENVVITPAIEPLAATVPSVDADGKVTQVPNPDIVSDDAARAKAQAIVDATPQAVIDYYQENN